METKPALSKQICCICWNTHQSGLSSDQEMASTYSFYNNWKASQTLHFLGVVGKQQFVACLSRYQLGKPFPLHTQSNEQNTLWHHRFELKQDLPKRLLPIAQRPRNWGFVLASV